MLVEQLATLLGTRVQLVINANIQQTNEIVTTEYSQAGKCDQNAQPNFKLSIIMGKKGKLSEFKHVVVAVNPVVSTDNNHQTVEVHLLTVSTHLQKNQSHQ